MIKNQKSKVKMKKKKKLYAYVDESGQDTRGLVFVVSILIMENEREFIYKALEKIEMKSGKKNSKWNKSRHEFRKVYMEEILELRELKGKIFFEIFSDTKKYIELTSFATAKAILKKSGGDNYKATVFVDGFKRKELEIFIRGLRDLRVKTRKIRGVKKDVNNPFIRVVDAICGLIRDKNENNEWADKMTGRLVDKGIIIEA